MSQIKLNGPVNSLVYDATTTVAFITSLGDADQHWVLGSPAPPSARNGGVRVEGPALVHARKSGASPASRER